MLKKESLSLLEYYKNDDRALVSASLDIWLSGFSKRFDLKLLCSRADYKDGKFTGRIAGKNCIGPEKVIRVQTTFPIKDYKAIVAYGDSSGDKAMLDWADHAFYRNLNRVTD